MKVNAKIYKGIEYVLLSDLPQRQQDQFLQHHDDEEIFIKILIDNKVVAKCIHYKDYEGWFESNFNEVKVLPTTHTEISINSASVKLA